MTIHSIISDELIFAGMEQATYDYSDVTINGISMQVEFLGSARARIIRLYSGDLNHYLNPLFTPGSVIYYAPKQGSHNIT